MGLNQVEVDERAINAEVDRILTNVPADLTPPAESPPIDGEAMPRELTLEEIQAAAQGYEGGAFLIVSKAADMFFPAWEVTQDERKQFSGSIAFALASWFPDQQLPPKWMALIALAGSGYAIVESRRDPKTGKLMPRRNEKPNPNAAGASAPPAAT